MDTTKMPNSPTVLADSAAHETSNPSMERLESISAFFDGEFEASQLLPESSIDPDPVEHKQDWAIYALIAASLTQPSGRALTPSAEFSARLSAAMAREPVHEPLATKAPAQIDAPTPPVPIDTRTGGWSRWFSWPSVAVVAAVAAVLWIAQPLITLDESTAVATPVELNQPTLAGTVISDYANAHRQYSGPIAVRQASFEPEAER